MTATALRDVNSRIARRRKTVDGTTISGSMLARARYEAGVPAATLARRLDVSRQYISKVERLPIVSIETAERYTAALKA